MERRRRRRRLVPVLSWRLIPVLRRNHRRIQLLVVALWRLHVWRQEVTGNLLAWRCEVTGRLHALNVVALLLLLTYLLLVVHLLLVSLRFSNRTLFLVLEVVFNLDLHHRWLISRALAQGRALAWTACTFAGSNDANNEQ